MVEPLPEEKISIKKSRLKKILDIYYSRPDIQKAIFEFSQNRETVPRFIEGGFGKRPDTLQYPNDVFGFVKKGATSFHCSEEIWKNPLEISTNMNETQFNELRDGWDLLLDIDSKYIDYSKIMAQQILRILKFHGVKNVGIKFSGSKGFHLIVPKNSFPDEINGIKTSDMFPLWPRIITKYIIENTKKELIEKVTELSKPSKYVKDFKAPKEVMPDLILVSPRHLFRAPYSLHEKTSLASVVLNEDELEKFELTDASPINAKIKNFLPDSEKGEATELLVQALDWAKENDEKVEDSPRNFDFKPVKLDKLSEDFFPPSIKKILQGVSDGKKRALFILINLFRSVGMEKDELEKRIYDWNEKNEIPLKKGYITSQLMWSYRNKIVLPPNFDKDYYKGIGVIPNQEELRYKNPSNYIIKKTLQSENKKKPNKIRNKSKSKSTKDNFKKNN